MHFKIIFLIGYVNTLRLTLQLYNELFLISIIYFISALFVLVPIIVAINKIDKPEANVVSNVLGYN